MIRLHDINEVRAAGIVGTRLMCKRCRRYNDFAWGPFYIEAEQVIVCRFCGNWIPVDLRRD